MAFWADFHFWQDEANFSKKNSGKHEKHRSVIVFVYTSFLINNIQVIFPSGIFRRSFTEQLTKETFCFTN